MTAPLRGRRAVVTGGTRGIGYAVAERLCADGAEVMVSGTRADGRGPAGTHYRQADFADDASLDAFAGVLREWAPDVLVNNAGVNRLGNFADYPVAEYDRIQRVNLHAPFVLCRAVLPGMRARGWGRIVNVSSIWGKISREQRAAYSSSKFGLDGMTAALAAEVARDGILANCVAPGFVDTELTRATLGEEGMRALAAQVPVGRTAQPAEIAAFVAWLAGPENTYVSGQNLAIDGGFTRV